jgi:hypothetical protein
MVLCEMSIIKGENMDETEIREMQSIMEGDHASILKAIDNICKPVNDKYCATCKVCCCKNCSECDAHYRISGKITNRFRAIVRQGLDELKSVYGWNDKKGYLGADGCKLPRVFRSLTCLRFTCNKFNSEDVQVLIALAEYLVHERRRYYYKSDTFIYVDSDR